MKKLLLAAVVIGSMAGCARQAGRPTLKDSNGWPVPTWAAMDGLVCFDPSMERYVSARDLHAKDHLGREYMCAYGAVDRGVQYDQPAVHIHSTAPATNTRAPSAAYPGGAQPGTMR